MAYDDDSLTQRLAELTGETLAGRFMLKELVGRGGYGAVFLAEQLSIGRPCAVKVLAPQVTQSDGAVHRFRREARATSRLEHQNTIVIFDFGVDEQRELLYIAMEYIDGMSLRDRIQEVGSLPLHDSVWIAHQAAGSLHDAHVKGLVHRDVKPHNIMLTTRGGDPNFVKVIDFGIAKFLDHAAVRETLQRVTSTGLVIGTPAYMSPEQVRSFKLDGRTDQYALAACVYQMLTGRTMFTGHSAIDVASKQLTNEVPSMRRYDPSIPEEVDEIVTRRALAKDPEDRFDTILEFTQALAASIGMTLSGEVDRVVTPASALKPVPEEVEAPTTEPVVLQHELPYAVSTEEDIAGHEETIAASLRDTVAVDAVPTHIPTEEPAATEESEEPEEVAEVAEPEEVAEVAEPEEPPVQVAAAAESTVEVEPRRLQEATIDAGERFVPERRSRLGWVVLLLCVVIGIAFAIGSNVDVAGVDEATATSDPEPVDSVEIAEISDPVEDPIGAAEPPLGDTGTVERIDGAAKTETPRAAASKAAAANVGAEEGVLEVHVVPWGHIFVNGVDEGEGRYRRLVKLGGSYKVELRQQGRTTTSKTVDVHPRKSTIVRLVARP